MMKLQTPVGLLPLVIYMGCTTPVYKPMDIAAYNQNTKQWRLDFNLFPLNSNWQNKLVTGKAPWTGSQCPLSDNPADWKTSPTCTSQQLHFNNGQIGCTDVFNRHGGHMNWFPVTEVGVSNFEDHSDDDDYNFYLKTPDSSLYLGSDDPDPMNQFVGLEFDSDEFPDPVDDDYNIWWNRFHNAVNDGDSFWGTILGTGNYAEAQAMAKDKLTIVTGMAGVDLGHDASNTWTTELHPVFGMFLLTDEETSINPDGSVAMNDTWSFFIRNKGNEGYCGTSTENAGNKRLNVFLPEMPYYYAGVISAYPADPSDNVAIDDGNVHITNWNGVTSDSDPRWEHWTKQLTNGGVVFGFNFDSDVSDGIFVGDIKLNWTIHISFKGFENLRNVAKFVDESKFKGNFKWIYDNKRELDREYETKADSLLYLRISKLNNLEKIELHQALTGKIVLPNMPQLEPIAKEKSTRLASVPAGKDSIDMQQFNAQVKELKIQELSARYSKAIPAANLDQKEYIQRKLLKREYIDAYLKSKHL